MIKPYTRQTTFRSFKIAIGAPVTFNVEADEAYLHLRNDCTLIITRERERALIAMVKKEGLMANDLIGSDVLYTRLQYGMHPLDLKSIPNFQGKFFSDPSVFLGFVPDSLMAGIRDTITLDVDSVEDSAFALVYLEEVHYVPADVTGV